MYKVIDVAKLFSVSKVTIYKKISSNKEALKGHIIKKKNVTYLDDEAVEIIKNSLQVNKEKVTGRLIDEELSKVYEDLKIYQEMNNKLKSEKISMINDEILELESMIRHLNSQIVVKQNHLKSKNDVLEKFKDLMKANKLLIKQLDRYQAKLSTR